MPEMPPAAAPEQQQQPPMGVSPATGPTPNKGFEAAVVQRLGTLINGLTDAFKMVGAGSDLGKDILKIINIAAKHVPPGAVSPAGERNTLEQMQMKNAQNGQQMAQLRGGQPGAGAPPGGAAPPPQMPRAA